MAKTYLPPIGYDLSDFDKVEEEILKLLKKEIYRPLASVLKQDPNKMFNSTFDLLRAIQDGQIVYYRGKFKGRFSSTLSREFRRIGAEWDKKQGAWLIPQSKLPIDVRNAIHMSITAFEKTLKAFDDKLKSFVPEKIAEKLNLTKVFDATLFKIEKEFQSNVKKITVAPEINKNTIKRIRDEYENNMERYIVEKTEKQISDLRSKVRDRVFAGYRSEGMIKTIQDSFKVSENWAKFIARQETKLMTCKYKEDRFLSAGITEYKWVTTRGANARESHQELNGKVFSFLDPPITSDKGRPERTNNPGEDFNCYCVAHPIIDASKLFHK